VDSTGHLTLDANSRPVHDGFITPIGGVTPTGGTFDKNDAVTFCTGQCILYPFTDAARYIPRDYLWVVPAALILPIFVIVAGCIHSCAPISRRVFSLIGLCFACLHSRSDYRTSCDR
jgi:hypothetical protein